MGARGPETFDTYCQRIWLQGALANENEFRRVMLAIVNDCQEYCRQFDITRLKCMVRVLHWVEPHCREGSLALAYELGCRLSALLVADACARLGLFDHAYRICEAINDLLADSDARQRARGLKPRPNNETRYTVLRVLGECKWIQTEQHRDRLISPERMLEDFERIYAEVDRKLGGELPMSPQQIADQRMHLELVEYELIKVAARFLPDRLIKLILRFNRRYGASLAAEVGHYKRGRPVADCLWYWDFELAKLWIAGLLTIQDLEYCHEQRVAAAHRQVDFNMSDYLYGLECECRLMRRQCAKRLEVLSG